jgi:hypothetical protein
MASAPVRNSRRCVYAMAKARGTALTGNPGYYCTYNPSNGFYDKHY